LGAALDFAGTETLRALALTGRPGQRRELAQGLRAERTPRELRLTVEAVSAAEGGAAEAVPEYFVPIPGEIHVPEFGLRLRIEVDALDGQPAGDGKNVAGQTARLRNWRPGDRVRLRYSSGPRKVKEVLERLRVTGTGRSVWPVLEVDGRIIWMKGVEVEPESGLAVAVTALEDV
jgi:tRNA(Ile)-lysidine synthase